MKERIKIIRNSHHWSQKQMAEFLNLPITAISKYERGLIKPGSDLLEKISNKFKINLNWLITGVGPMFIGQQNNKKGHSDDDAVAGVRVPLYNVAAAAGSGCYICQENITGHLLFPHHYIEKVLCVSGKDLLVVTASGDSMVPTINDNDLVMVDQSQKILKSGSVYLLRFDDTLVVKRVQLKPEGIVQIVSDNKMLDPFEIKGSEITVLGKVVWVGGKF